MCESRKVNAFFKLHHQDFERKLAGGNSRYLWCHECVLEFISSIIQCGVCHRFIEKTDGKFMLKSFSCLKARNRNRNVSKNPHRKTDFKGITKQVEMQTCTEARKRTCKNKLVTRQGEKRDAKRRCGTGQRDGMKITKTETKKCSSKISPLGEQSSAGKRREGNTKRFVATTDNRVPPITLASREFSYLDNNCELTFNMAEASKTRAGKTNRINPNYVAEVIRNLPREYLPNHLENIFLPAQSDGCKKFVEGANVGRGTARNCEQSHKRP